LDERLGDVVDRSGSDRLRCRRSHSLQEADVDADPARGAGHRQVDELIAD
jgi:hypothetical protein